MTSPASPFDADDDSDSSSSEAVLSPFLSRRPSLSSATTTSNASMGSSVSSAASVWSMTESMREQAFKQEYGRGINNYSDVYKLPADEEELERLGMLAYLATITAYINSAPSDKQHLIFMDVMGKYCPPLESVMRDDTPGETKACLDLGCGSGAWYVIPPFVLPAP